MLWNGLDEEVKQAKTLASFKRLLHGPWYCTVLSRFSYEEKDVLKTVIVIC